MKIILYIISIIVLISCGSDNPIVPVEPDPKPDPKPEPVNVNWNMFADDFQKTLISVYSGSSGTYITRPDKPDFNYWFNAHVLDVLVDGYNRTKNETYIKNMKNLLRGIEIKNGRYWQVYVDDMAWLGISCMNAWKATNDKEYKDVAIYILNEIRKAHTEVLGGGLQWRFDQPNGKQACSTAPGAILALRLYASDKEDKDILFAKELFEWETNTLRDPNSYLIWDNISLNASGNIEIKKDWVFTYNVGTYVGMARDLYINTGEKKYLDLAVQSARASVTRSEMVKNNMFIETSDHDGGLFKGILVRYLTELVFTNDIPESFKTLITDFLKYNANTLYKSGTSPAPMVLASSDWSKRPERAADISTQVSAMMLAEAVAKLDKLGLLK